MNKRLILIISGRRAVGKSFFAVNFVQFLKDRHVQAMAIDTDHEHPALRQIHPETALINFSDGVEIDLIVENLETTDLMIVDWRTDSTADFLGRWAEFQLPDLLQGLNAELTVVLPIDHEPESIEDIRSFMTRLGDDCRYVVVRNRFPNGFCPSFDQSKTRSRLLREFRAREIFMPKLYGRVVEKMISYEVSITRALHHPSFSTIDRQRLKHWQGIFYDQLDAVQDFLLPRVHVQGIRSGRQQVHV